jgi:hypothetical protein
MMKRSFLLAGLSIASFVFSAYALAAKEITIVAQDTITWTSEGLQSEDDVLQVPVETGDVLHFKFSSAPHPKTHGITTQNGTDEIKVQKRGDTDGKGKYLQELGDGPSRFGPTFSGANPDEEITAVKVLADFPGSLNLMCSFHGDIMLMTLKRGG